MNIIVTVFFLIVIVNILVYGENHECEIVGEGYKICKTSHAIKSVEKDPDSGESHYLTIKDKQISTIDPGAFKNLIILGLEITLADQRLTLDPLSFQGLKQLQVLKISSGVVHLQRNLFQFIPLLCVLTLRIDGSNQNFKNGFPELPVLRSLKVFKSSLRHISTETFYNFGREMYDLDLSDNDIETISPSAFTSFKLLRILKLDSNKLTRFQPGTFDIGLDLLQKLSITSNKLLTIEKGIFNRLNRLETLNFENNSIESIGADTFVGTIIEDLNLSNNNLWNLNSKMFTGLKTLKNIYLQKNRINSIDNGTFSGLELKELNLEENKLVLIEGIFQGVIIEKLLLFGNEIVYVSPRAFENSTLNIIKLNKVIPYMNDSYRELPDTQMSQNFSAHPILQ